MGLGLTFSIGRAGLGFPLSTSCKYIVPGINIHNVDEYSSLIKKKNPSSKSNNSKDD